MVEQNSFKQSPLDIYFIIIIFQVDSIFCLCFTYFVLFVLGFIDLLHTDSLLGLSGDILATTSDSLCLAVFTMP